MTERLSLPDARLLATLERAFERHAGPDGVIDQADLARALGLRDPELVRRMLTGFDLNADGVIQRDEFLKGVRTLLFGTDREKLWFAFRLHDRDNDGSLDKSEVLSMIAVSLAESEVVARSTQPPEHLARALFSAADFNRDGKISFEEFATVVNKRPRLLEKMTRNEAIWIAPNEELLAWVAQGKRPGPTRFGRWLEDHGLSAAVILLWAMANVVVFLGALQLGSPAPYAFQVGRALGKCIDLDGALILVPMMRRFLGWLRATWLGLLVPVDDAITFHRVVGHTLFALGVTHAASFTLAYATGHVNVLDVVGTGRGATGAVLLGVFAVMWFFSLAFVRRSKRFELFYFTHLLYVAWLGLAIAHAPEFLWAAGVPLLGFLIEQAMRLSRRGRRAAVLSNQALRSGVTRVEIERPKDFVAAPGDYVFLRIPAIARREWHPFTISSAPERDTLTFHVRSLGNWTASLRERAVAHPDEAGLVAYVDGPYRSPTAAIFASRVAVLIGAGIGVTPFSSVLESIVLRGNAPGAAGNLKKAHFIWLNKDAYSFEWFTQLLSDLEQSDARGLLDVSLVMTGAKSGVASLGLEIAREAMHAAGRSDVVTGLRTKTHFGQPDWDTMLGLIAREHRGEPVDVYFCGPPGLGSKLKPICQKYEMSFHEEKF